MKRVLMTLLMLIGAVSTCFAVGRVNTGVSLGGATIIDSYKSGGSLEVGFPILTNLKVNTRIYLSLDGVGTDSITTGILMAQLKATIGGGWADKAETYAFLAGGAGLYSNFPATPITSPFLWDLEAGGGIQFDLSPQFGYFVEVGGGYNAPFIDTTSFAKTPLETGYATIRTGFRFYF